MNRVKMYSHRTENILPIRAMHYLSTGTYIYSCLNRSIHTDTKFDYNTCKGRNANKLKSSASKSNYGKKRITFFGTHIFNSIDEDIKSLKSAKAFKWALGCRLRHEEFMNDCFSNDYLKKFSKTER